MCGGVRVSTTITIDYGTILSTRYKKKKMENYEWMNVNVELGGGPR